MNALLTPLSVAMGIVFCSAGVLKLLDRAPLASFLHILGIPSAVAAMTTTAIAIVETTLGLFLILFQPNTTELWLIAGIAALMMGILVFGRWRGAGVPCGCFGAADRAPIQISIVRAGLLLVMTLIILWLTSTQNSPSANDPGARFVGLPLGLLWTGCLLVVSRLSLMRGVFRRSPQPSRDVARET